MSRNQGIRVALHVTGIIQGVGFRPFVYRQAQKYGLSGWIKNGRSGVSIEVAGTVEKIDAFCHALRFELPAPGKVDTIEQRPIADDPDDSEMFRILESDEGAAPSPLLPPDLVICADCCRELHSPTDRRNGYAFICCAHCGPRYSIVEALPYDRARTSMRAFPLCASCLREYEDPENRRFHAEPLACAECGPRVSLLARDGTCLAGNEEAILSAGERLRNGDIVALRGLGGFQLLCDATQSLAVAKLRQRKLRQEKPFAVLFPNLEAALENAFISPREREALMGSQGPIVLLHRKETSTIAPEVAPNCPLIGAMLPTTALHALLCAAVSGPLVCTSGNLSSEPLCVETPIALQRLGTIADVFLDHDRPIVRPVDDSVVRAGPQGIHVLRRSRGFAPLPVFQLDDDRCILGLGAHLKNTIALLVRGEVVMSQHLGDMDDPDSVDLLSATVRDLTHFFNVRPDIVASDLHPDFASTRLARSLAQQWGAEYVGVQHHHAHVAAVMTERKIRDDVLALVWDGYGFGLDGQAWGGEAFVVRRREIQRVGHLKPLRLPGADKAAEEPWRSALGLLVATLGSDAKNFAKNIWPDKPIDALFVAMERGFASPLTSSMGRLFDAVSALLGIRLVTSFEGQAAMELEWLAASNPGDLPEPYPLSISVSISDDSPWLVDNGPLVRGIIADLRTGMDRREIAARFIASLVDLAVRVCQKAKLPNVVLAGGCFQNDLLTRALERKLSALGFQVHLPQEVPINDGGISAGQVAVAAQIHSLRRGA
jgi:hydrogenase maturation protein HypF